MVVSICLIKLLAALAGQEDEEIDHIETLRQKPRSELVLWEKVQLAMFHVMQSMGFFGILLSASVGMDMTIFTFIHIH